MNSKRDTDRACEERLRKLLAPDEELLAVGRADEFPEGTEDFSPQGHWRFLIVTSQRLLMTEWSAKGANEVIPYDDLVMWADGTQYHRYVVKLFHPPLQRDERVPAHRFLWIEWGTAWKPRTRETTTLRFSHRDTAAGAALRPALQRSESEHVALTLIEVPRSERMQGSFGILRAEDPGSKPRD